MGALRVHVWALGSYESTSAVPVPPSVLIWQSCPATAGKPKRGVTMSAICCHAMVQAPAAQTGKAPAQFVEVAV